MPYSNISTSLSAADKAAIEGAFNTIKAKLKFLIHLTPEERQELVKMGDKSLAFVSKVHEYTNTHPQYCPPMMDKVEFERDFQLAQDLDNILQLLKPLTEAVEHTSMALGSEALNYARGYYSITGYATTINSPGAEAVNKDLAERYPHTGPGTPTGEDKTPTD
jgi:hypothetical protein